MSQQKRNKRVAEITSAWIDGIASDHDLAELNEILQGDPDACEQYLDLIEMHAALEQDQAGESIARQMADLVALPKGNGADTRQNPKFSVSRRGLQIAALLAFFVGLALLWRPTPPEPMTEGGIAVISQLANPQWAGDQLYSEGDQLKPGVFRLASGLAQLEFFSGASVIVEGPAELELASAWLAKCRIGRLRVSVPEPAQGFTIETSDYRAVDLGTEFALTVGNDGQSEVHVLEGEVRLDSLEGRELQKLAGGDAIRSGGRADFDSLESKDDFVGRQQLLSLVQNDWQSRYQSWTLSRQSLKSRPNVLALFDFEGQKPWDRQLENQSRSTSNGAIIGAQWTDGRWPGKGALEFKRPSDRVRLNIPGEFDQLTLSSWIRVQSFDRWLSSLLLTDGFEAGEVHWQISDQGELVLGISGAKPNINSYSPIAIPPSDLGRWIHLAVTVDRNSGNIIHYLDGEVISQTEKSEIPPLRIGNAEIGNWQAQQKPHPLRSFNGKIDEMIIFDRVLNAGEIKALSGGDS